MKLNQMKNIVEEFIKNDDISSILIDGKWGIGKTHTLLFDIIKPYKRLHKKNIKFAYSSLFGKNSIDEINTEIYNTLNPKLNKALGVISHVSKIIEIGINLSGFSISFDSNQIKKNKKYRKKKIKTVIILDDLERKNINILTDDITGYINELIIQGAKVIVLSNLNELKQTDFDNYREKVFDRIYKINDTDDEIIKNLTRENYQYTKKTNSIIDSNLRMLIKTNSLFNQIKRYIEQKEYSFNEWTDLYAICAYTVKESLTSFYSNALKNSKKNNQGSILHYYNNDQIRMVAFEEYILNKYSDVIKNHKILIPITFDVLESENYLTIDYCFNKSPEQNSPLNIDSIFYFSDANKLKYAKLQYDYILDQDYIEHTTKNIIKNTIRDWYRNITITELNIDEEKLFNKLFQLNIVFETYFEKNTNFIDFVERQIIFNNEKEKNTINKLLLDYGSENFDYDKMEEVLLKIPTLNDSIKKEIISILIKSNFCITKIHSDMDPIDWRLAHSICDLIGKNFLDYKENLYNYLINYKKQYKNDKSLVDRIDGLIEQYQLKP